MCTLLHSGMQLREELGKGYMHCCRFMVGTEQGCALLCNRKAKTPADRIVAAYTGARSLLCVTATTLCSKVISSLGPRSVMLRSLASPVAAPGNPMHSSPHCAVT